MRRQRAVLVVAVLLGLGYAWLRGAFVAVPGATAPAGAALTESSLAGLATATFAAGCFWCAESDFEKVDGVRAVISGYTGGSSANPSYEQVSSGGTGHAEAVEVFFDPAVVSYEQLLDHFWRNVDPFAANRQFCDVGEQYRAAIFVRDAAQRTAAEASKRRVSERLHRPVVVEISDAGPFYRAEQYHQDYYRTHPAQYRFYRWNCGRDARLAEVWGAQ
jgi:peptide-methionine (S)-S-oxide reductase